jgi:hypothetical protein
MTNKIGRGEMVSILAIRGIFMKAKSLVMVKAPMERE